MALLGYPRGHRIDPATRPKVRIPKARKKRKKQMTQFLILGQPDGECSGDMSPVDFITLQEHAGAHFRVAPGTVSLGQSEGDLSFRSLIHGV